MVTIKIKMVNQQKIYQVENLKEEIKSGKGVYLLDYQGFGADFLNNLRQAISESGGGMLVVKNSLFKRALEDLGFEISSEAFNGPTACLLSKEDEVASLSAFCNFLEEEGVEPVFKGGVLVEDEQVLETEKVVSLSKLPSIKELQTKLVGTLASPLRGLMLTLKAPSQNLVLTLKALQQKKEKSEN